MKTYLLAASFLAVSFIPNESRADLTWNLASNGTWDTSTANWTDGEGALSWSNDETAVFSGATGYAVTIGSGITQTGVTINDNGAWTFAGAGLGGTGGITKNGSGVLTLNAANTFSGDVTLNGGSITINNGSALGSGALIVDRTSGGTFLHANKPSATVEIGNDIQISGSASSYTVTQNGGNGLNFTGVISGGGANTVLRFYSGGQGDSTTRVKLSGENTFAGMITVERGSLVAGNEKAFGSALIDLYTNNNGTLGTLIFETGGIFTNNIRIRYLTPTFNTNDFDVVLNGVISLSGGAGFRKIGTGALTLGGNNSAFSGAIAVVEGALLVDGSSGTGAVSVANGATLGGSGTIGGVVTVASGGILSPGNSPGTLNFGNNVTLQSGAILVFEIADNATHDVLNFTGVNNTLTFSEGAELHVVLGGGDLSGIYEFFTNAVVAGWNAETVAITGLDGYTYDFTATGLSIAVIPEPSTYALWGAASVVGLVMLRSRRHKTI